VHQQRVSCFDEIQRHWVAHVANTNESEFHCKSSFSSKNSVTHATFLERCGTCCGTSAAKMARAALVTAAL
jgi:hypothetical protein